jgi:hypothetical protein
MKILTIKFKILTILIIVTALFGCQKLKDKTVPKELLGVWVSTEQRYAGCSFEVTNNMIIFNNNNLSYSSINHVTGIEKAIEEGQTIYLVDYKDSEGLECRISLFYSRGRNRDMVRFKNEMGVVWTKKEADET